MRKIIIYTACYPYAKTTESYLTSELNAVKDKGYDITIVPIKKEQYLRPMPDHVKLDCSLRNMKWWRCLWAFFRSLSPSLIVAGIKEVAKYKKPKFWVDLFKYLFAIEKVYLDLEKRANKEKEACVFYCYWLSFAPVAFALYKRKHPNTPHRFVSRGHGSDIYATKMGVFYPLRSLGLKYIDAVYTVSDFGARFLQEQYPLYAKKIHISKLGVPAIRNMMLPFDDVYRFVSVSSVYPFKRIPLLFESLYAYASSHQQTPIEWIHYGDGGDFDNLTNKVRSANPLPNFKVELKGRVTNDVILEMYRNTNVTGNVLLSTSEGIPVSIMEALAASTPVIATNVGGVKEIVNSDTGCLLPVDFIQEQFDQAIDYLIDNRVQLAKTSYDYFDKNYSDKNFIEFYRQLAEY